MQETDDVIVRTIKGFRERKKRIEEHGVNCIPSPFECFRNDFPGVEQGKYYLISGAAKASKTQITSLLFLYTPILYAYENPDKVHLKIFYFPLEELDIKITARFCSYLLYTKSKREKRYSPMVLNCVNENATAPDEVYDLLEFSPKYRDILNFFKDHVEFRKEKNPTGCWKTVTKYAEEHGTIHKKWDERLQKEVFDYYVPDDPLEYVIIIWDHAGLTSTETIDGQKLNLKESIDRLSGFFVYFRDYLHYTPVMVQQQNMDTISLDAYKSKKIMPTLAGLADTKNTGKDCSLFLGITNPYGFEIDDYRGYNTKLLGGYCRFLEVVMSREGESNGYLPLYFDGAVNYFLPLPKPDDATKLNQVYRLIDSNINPQSN